jgi:hypothetical protein
MQLTTKICFFLPNVFILHSTPHHFVPYTLPRLHPHMRSLHPAHSSYKTSESANHARLLIVALFSIITIPCTHAYELVTTSTCLFTAIWYTFSTFLHMQSFLSRSHPQSISSLLSLSYPPFNSFNPFNSFQRIL